MRPARRGLTPMRPPKISPGLRRRRPYRLLIQKLRGWGKRRIRRLLALRRGPNIRFHSAWSRRPIKYKSPPHIRRCRAWNRPCQAGLCRGNPPAGSFRERGCQAPMSRRRMPNPPCRLPIWRRHPSRMPRRLRPPHAPCRPRIWRRLRSRGRLQTPGEAVVAAKAMAGDADGIIRRRPEIQGITPCSDLRFFQGFHDLPDLRFDVNCQKAGDIELAVLVYVDTGMVLPPLRHYPVALPQ